MREKEGGGVDNRTDEETRQQRERRDTCETPAQHGGELGEAVAVRAHVGLRLPQHEHEPLVGALVQRHVRRQLRREPVVRRALERERETGELPVAAAQHGGELGEAVAVRAHVGLRLPQHEHEPLVGALVQRHVRRQLRREPVVRRALERERETGELPVAAAQHGGELGEAVAVRAHVGLRLPQHEHEPLVGALVQRHVRRQLRREPVVRRALERERETGELPVAAAQHGGELGEAVAVRAHVGLRLPQHEHEPLRERETGELPVAAAQHGGELGEAVAVRAHVGLRLPQHEHEPLVGALVQRHVRRQLRREPVVRRALERERAGELPVAAAQHGGELGEAVAVRAHVGLRLPQHEHEPLVGALVQRHVRRQLRREPVVRRALERDRRGSYLSQPRSTAASSARRSRCARM
ncbi:unnamed protein product [Euphydryas editha]|uniref:Uncharacterized protein n=1 Tax=Euphydryas editha TaxID=104508 RepID=A0AAU9TYB7_EUPED|nr:unnamed protein product [Euphydryas editha]